ncbi:MAG: tetratricopeptide repeat protein [Candidatus Omnitrophota bacterium]
MKFYSIIILAVIFLSGCGSRYSAERLYWQANQIVKDVVKDTPIESLTAEKYQKIIAAYQRVVDKYPLEPLAAQSQFIIAQIYTAQGQFPQAEKELIKITRNFSRNSAIASQAQFLIGNLYEKQDDWKKALSEYEKVIDLYPLSSLGLKTPIYIAQHYKLKQNAPLSEKAYEKAKRDYEKLIDEYSGTSVAPIIMDYLALAYSNEGNWDEAIDTWQGISNEYPQSPLAAKSLLTTGEIYTKQIKDLEKAIKAYEDFVTQYPRSQVIKQIKLQIGKLYVDKGEIEKARQNFLEAIRDYPEEAELCANARLGLAVCYEKDKNYDKAIEEYLRIKKDYPDTKTAFSVPFFIAQHYFHRGADKEKIEDAFAQAISEYRDIVENGKDASSIIDAGRLISLCYIQQKKWDEAIDYMQGIADKYPDNPQAEMFLFNIAGIYQSELKEPNKAINIYEELINKFPASQLVSLAKTQLEALQDDGVVK